MADLPPGQRFREDFPRFGLDQFANRVPKPAPLSIAVSGPLDPGLTLDQATLADLPRVEQVSDLHCVTTWTARDLRWSGWRFTEVWERCIAARLQGPVHWLVLGAADGFTSRLPLDDALADDVLLADGLDGGPLPLLHGGPVRFVAPQHYGYKNPKHVVSIACVEHTADFRPNTPFAFMEHPRARVQLEERGRAPGRLLRWLYRPLVERTVRRFQQGWDAHSENSPWSTAQQSCRIAEACSGIEEEPKVRPTNGRAPHS